MEDIKQELKLVIKDLYGLDFNPDITPSPANIDADYSTNAPLKLAKELHKSPMEIAAELDARIGTHETVSREPHEASEVSEPRDGGRERTGLREFRTSVSTPGFLNFTLSDETLSSKIEELSKNFTDSIKSDAYKNKTVICEFSDPNPFKVLHVGHLYTSIVGDSISRLFEYAGAKVIRANFGGDVGLHVAKTLYILQQKNPKELQIEDIARCYVEGTAAYEDDAEAKARIAELNKEIYKINSERVHGTPLSDLYWQGRELSYDYFKDFYAKIGIHFDKFYPESTVAPLGLKIVKEQLEKGVYEMSDGAVIFNGEKYGLHTRVFVNKGGVPTYEAKDVGLIFTKNDDYHFDKSVVITGSEQLDYMKVVLKSIEQYAPELVEKTIHLIHGLVKLPGNVKMSSRKGNFLKAVDVLGMVDEALVKEHGSTDAKVSLAATKYAFLKYKMGGNIIFDPHESVNMTGNSGPYLLYSCVRAKKILAGASGSTHSAIIRDDKNEQVDNQAHILEIPERQLMIKLLSYKDVLGEAVSEMAPHKVANYLYELAQDFSRFYEKCPVIGSKEESKRIEIVKAYLNIMTHGLGLLGIEIPEEM